MTDRSKLLALADAVEKLTGPDREVDAEIGATQGIRTVNEGHPLGICCYDKAGQSIMLPRYTASLDAAMTLVPEGCWDHMEVYRPDHQTLGWTVHLLPNGNFTAANSHEGFGASFTLALTAAALRAQAEALA